jgi:hypothetical protein
MCFLASDARIANGAESNRKRDSIPPASEL